MAWRTQPRKCPKRTWYGWQSDRWRRKHPDLARAYRFAVDNFSKIDGVIGFGIGRRFRESSEKYAPSSREYDGLCIQVMVRGKRPLKEIPEAERIPKYIEVAPSSRGKKARRVPVDILTGSRPRLQTYKHLWPTAGRLNVGRLFTFDRAAPAGAPSGVFAPGQAELGTTGALIRTSRGEFATVSAGHVFVDICSGQLATPGGPRCVGLTGPNWVALAPNNLAPATLQNGAWIMDAVCMRVPPVLLPSIINWPPLFDKCIASRDDIDAAIQNNHIGGFVWVERQGGQSIGLPIDLQAGLDSFSAAVCLLNPVHYRFIWPYRLLDHQTVGGDSGAGVFVPAIDKPGFCRLLGFHFLYDEDAGRGYALDAGVFFRKLFGPAADTAFSFP